MKGFRRFSVTNIQRPMETENPPLQCGKNICNFCDFSCSKKSDWIRHSATAKHKKACISDNILHPKSSSKYICPNCSKIYISRNGLWIHKKKCNGSENIVIQTDDDATENITLEVN